MRQEIAERDRPLRRVRLVQRTIRIAQDAKADELSAVLYDLADGVRAVAVALSPYLPETAPRILGALRQPVDLALEQVAYGKTGETDGIEAAQPLFPRVDLPTAAA